MCGDYIDGPDEDGNSYMRLQVSDKEILRKSPVGTRAKFQVTGEVVEVEAPKMVTDYDAPWDYDKARKSGAKRPKKERPGVVRLKLDKGDPQIDLINSKLMDEEAD